jgi:hypothetical protein
MEKWIVIASFAVLVFMIVYCIIDIERQIKNYEKTKSK